MKLSIPSLLLAAGLFAAVATGCGKSAKASQGQKIQVTRGDQQMLMLDPRIPVSLQCPRVQRPRDFGTRDDLSTSVGATQPSARDFIQPVDALGTQEPLEMITRMLGLEIRYSSCGKRFSSFITQTPCFSPHRCHHISKRIPDRIT